MIVFAQPLQCGNQARLCYICCLFEENFDVQTSEKHCTSFCPNAKNVPKPSCTKHPFITSGAVLISAHASPKFFNSEVSLQNLLWSSIARAHECLESRQRSTHSYRFKLWTNKKEMVRHSNWPLIKRGKEILRLLDGNVLPHGLALGELKLVVYIYYYIPHIRLISCLLVSEKKCFVSCPATSKASALFLDYCATAKTQLVNYAHPLTSNTSDLMRAELLNHRAP